MPRLRGKGGSVDHFDLAAWMGLCLSALALLRKYLKDLLEFVDRRDARRERRRERRHPEVEQLDFREPLPGSSFSYHGAKRELDRRYWGDDEMIRKRRPPRDMMDRDDDFRF